MSRSTRALLTASLLAVAMAACSDSGPAATPKPPVAASPTPAAEPATNTLAAAHAGGETAKPASRSPSERPLPAFEGRSLDGKSLSISSLLGKRVLLFFFNPDDAKSLPVTRAVVEVSRQARRQNFQVLGIGVGSSHDRLLDFTRAQGVDFPVIDDSSARIAGLFRLRDPLLVLGADAEGYLTFALPWFNTEAADAEKLIASQLREALRVPEPERAHSGELLKRPLAPRFEAEDLDGKPVSLGSFEGRPLVLLFFLHTCPHCHHAMAFLKQELAKIPEPQRPVLLGVSLQNRPVAVRDALKEAGLDFFPVLLDPDQKINELYGVRGSVPDLHLIGRDGRIAYHMSGWRDDRDPALMRMQLARLAGSKVPMLLSPDGYTGNDACGTCHEVEFAAWQITTHARAYDTLVTHGSDRNAECVSCHVVGFGKTGGYSFDRPAEYLENVGCESCHGKGGGHLSPQQVTQGDYAPVCGSCHNPEHSLGFDYDVFRARVSHKAIAALPPEELAKRAAGAGFERQLLPAKLAYVGSEACRGCHPTEFATWSKSPHARALASLETKKKASDAACLLCHTTGFERDGGFPSGGVASRNPDLARVGCESCHGPGAEHVPDQTRRAGSIVSLGDKCESCVILQICGSCHDEVNDPDFEFQVQEHIERQRHGTIEAGTGKPLGASAWRSDERGAERRLAEILRQLDERS